MADLWIFGRKPAALVRHRHGGFNATFPMNGDTVVEQAGLTLARDAAREKAERAEAERPPRVDGRDAQNVLSFQPRANRGTRNAHSPRHGGRPAPFRD
ncbi:MAG: hypothetical protein R8L07_03100 [Alphaproteobacteria bacterium]|nr:hypothetical protein [Alphaproteobacteria bacterium]